MSVAGERGGAYVPPRLPLLLLRDHFAVVRLAADAPVPPWASGGRRRISAVVRTDDELSILTDDLHAPATERAERGWRALKVRGPLPFDLVGIFASIVQPLADGRIAIFALSTFDTDYVMVKEERLAEALAVLARAGHAVEMEPEAVASGHLAASPPVGS